MEQGSQFIFDDIHSSPFEFKVFFMHKIGLRFSDWEFRNMPKSRFNLYLFRCWAHNEYEKENSK